MTQGKPGRLIFTFAIPLMAGNIFQQLYTVVDTMVVGKFLGVDALAALGAADWLNWMMLGIVQGFTQGFAIKMAQDFGAGNHTSLRKTIGNSAVLVVLFSILLVIAGQLSATPIVMAYNLLACILRSLGDSKTPLYAMIIASITNIVLDVLFVFGFKWGIGGAAAATLIAQVISSVYCYYHLKKIEMVKLAKTDWQLNGALMGRLLYLGFPMAFQNAIIAVGGMVVQFVVNGFGVIFIAGFTATNKLYGLLEIAATSYGYAVVTYVGQNLGAKELNRISQGMKASLLIAGITSVVIAGIMLVFGRVILSCFISGTPAEVEEAMQIAYFYLAVMSVSLPILYLLHVVRSGIQGLGNTLLPMLSGVAEFVMRVGSALILPAIVGEIGIFFAETAAWLGADIVLVISYFVVMHRLRTRTFREHGTA